MRNLLSKRYKNDNRESFYLTEKQISARDTIKKKLKENFYETEKINCPCCDIKDYKILSQKDTYGLPVQVVLCKECGLVYNNPCLSGKSLAPFYDGEYKNLDRVFPEIQDYFQLEKEKGEIIESFLKDNNLLEQIKNKVIVEIGCGAGGVLKHFSEKGFKVLGCDLSSQNVNYARDTLSLEVYHSDIDVLEKVISEKKLDIGLVIYEQVFEHLPNPRNELNKIKKIINDDTLLYIGVPGLRNIGNHYQSNFLRYLQLPHLMHFDLQSLTNLFGISEFSLVIGDQVIQAIFKLNKKAVPYKNGSNDLLVFLQNLEKNYKQEQVLKFLKYLPLNVFLFFGRYLKKGILNVPFLSTSTKNKISKIIHFVRSKFP